MAGTRKRHRPSKPGSAPCKRLKTGRDADSVLCRLPTTSKTRRRRIAALGNHTVQAKSSVDGDAEDKTEAVLVKLLDRTVVCMNDEQPWAVSNSRRQDFRAISRRYDGGDESSLLEGNTPQSEIVDFAIWLLFHRIYRTSCKPAHILCHGYQRSSGPIADDDQGALLGIPGIVLHYPNSHVGTLKSRPWSDLLNLLGKDGEQIMLDLILNCAVYAGVESGKGNFYQLSGVPMTEVQPLEAKKSIQATSAPDAGHTRLNQDKCHNSSIRPPSAITFVRNRMFYARATLNAKGKVRFGLRHIHVLNRYPDPQNPYHTLHILKYIFPRQFGLHNCFTSTVDSRQTTQPFQDYTLREHEIVRKASCKPQDASSARPHLPKRLRGEIFKLVQKLQKLHARCAYHELLKHCCPFRGKRPTSEPSDIAATSEERANSDGMALSQVACNTASTQRPQGQTLTSQHKTELERRHSVRALQEQTSPIVDQSTPVSHVSAFCQAVVANLIPNDFWGQGVHGDHNKETIRKEIDRFIRLRKFESLTLHVVFQELKIRSMTWLAPPHVPAKAAISSSDMDKRRELLLEFLYYLFDSILIPLVRSNFHVTESNHHKNRIFYFRHDVWRALTEPAMTRIKKSMFEEVPFLKARQLLDARSLGFSQIRLLPKDTGLRPIMNLRRRVTKLQGGKAVLGRSINSIMAPVHKMLDYERQQNPSSIGSALFSVGEMYPKLRVFRDHLRLNTEKKPTLYFAKVDVKSCFDTIPQRGAVKVMEQLVSENVYRIARHAQIKASDPRRNGKGIHKQAKPARKFLASAHPPLDFRSFDELVEETFASERKNTIFVDNVLRTAHKKQKMLDMLKDHVERNIIKIGKKFFRQKEGIPQGSVLSSLLCNCFYARLEIQHLAFVNDSNSLLLRLIDDFLFVTTSKMDAVQFLQTMHDGMDEYGVKVNPAKTLTNFAIKINGTDISRTTVDSPFPYCGTLIDTRTLAISKDRERRKATALSDSLTVEQSSTPGQIFYRKAMNAFKIQTHKMFLDTKFNSNGSVLNNIYQNFCEAAMKYYRYVKSMQASKRPQAALLVETLHSMIDMAFVLVKAKHRRQTSQDDGCAVSKRQVQWLALTAFNYVLGKKQTKFRPVLAWVREELGGVRPKDSKKALRLVKVAQKGQAAFRGFKY